MTSYFGQVVSRKKPTKPLAFEEIFVHIRPNILFVKDLEVAEYLYDPILSQIEADSYETPEPEGALAMTSCQIVVSAFLDGGLAFVENEWGDGDSDETAFEQWVREREAAGEEWDEEDFVHQPTIDYEGPPLLSGCYLIGLQAINHILSMLKARTPAGLTDKDWHEESSRSSSRSYKRALPAEAIANKLQSCSWDELAVGRS